MPTKHANCQFWYIFKNRLESAFYVFVPYT